MSAGSNLETLNHFQLNQSCLNRVSCLNSLNFLYINNTTVITFKYKVKINNVNILVPLIKITVPAIFDIDVEPAYIQQYLFENILQLNKTKKTFGKDALLKPLPVLLENNNLSLYNYYQYKEFFDKIKNAL